MAQSSKGKTKASGSFSSDSEISSREGKKPCNSPRKVPDEDDLEKQSNMSDKITAQRLRASKAGYKVRKHL